MASGPLWRLCIGSLPPAVVRRRRCLGKGGRSARGRALTSGVDASEDEPGGSVAPAREIIRDGARPGPMWKRAPRPTPATTTRPAAHDAPRLSSAFGWWQSAALARWCGCGSDASTSSSSFMSATPKTQQRPKLADKKLARSWLLAWSAKLAGGLWARPEVSPYNVTEGADQAPPLRVFTPFHMVIYREAHERREGVAGGEFRRKTSSENIPGVAGRWREAA